MQRQNKSGSGVTATKVVREVNNVINNSEMTRKEKLNALENIQLENRPGREKAERIISNYVHKFDWYTERHILSQTPRGYELEEFSNEIKPVHRKWHERFSRYISSFVDNFNFVKPLWPNDILNKVGLTAKTAHLKPLIDRSPLSSDYYKVRPELKPYADKIRNFFLEWYEQAKQQEKEIIQFKEDSGLDSDYFGKYTPFFDFQKGKGGYTKFRGYYVTTHEIENEDWNRYSKAWHNKYGAYRWIERRYILLSKRDERIEIDVKKWQGNWLINALSKYFNIQSSCPKGRKKIQLNKAFTVNFIKQINGYELYERAFENIHIDYAIFDTKTKTAYHDENYNNLITGLKRKFEAKYNFENENITKETAKKLGFCLAGVKQFCEDNNIDYEGSYTRKELRNIVVQNRQVNCEKYKQELKKLGIILNCK